MITTETRTITRGRRIQQVTERTVYVITGTITEIIERPSSQYGYVRVFAVVDGDEVELYRRQNHQPIGFEKQPPATGAQVRIEADLMPAGFYSATSVEVQG